MRIGTPALTTRGFKEEDFRQVADFLDRTLKIGLDIQAKASTLPSLMRSLLTQQVGKSLADFVNAMDCPETRALKEEIHAFAVKFPMPGLGF